ncbi:MAG: zinc ribbon domain-containing protein [Spirochaetaceae bacterium]|nr:MAG: zinc ribbon domain-containing protein [Spirochaetaceae bacterium]
MPTYDYKCTSCGNRFEAFQKISDAPLEKCPKCKKKVKRLISAGLGIIFKGSGFYSTDNKKSSPDSAKVDSSKKDKPKKDKASKSDAKVTA